VLPQLNITASNTAVEKDSIPREFVQR
jgi:hypothetical protein